MKALVLVAATAASVALTGTANATPTVYDTFSEPTINAKLWRAGYSNEGAVELITEVRNGDLFMRIRGIADETATTGDRETVANRFFMNENEASDVRMFQMYSRVNLADTRDCTDPAATDTQSRFLHVAQWFNNGASTGPDDYTGNVYTVLGFRKSADTEIFGDRVDVLANVGICSDPACNASENLWFIRFGGVAVKENVLLRTAWDENTKEFRFFMKPQGETAITQSFSYAGLASDNLPPVTKSNQFPRHQLRAQAQVAQCDVANNGGKRPFASIDAKVYNVKIDDTAEGY